MLGLGTLRKDAPLKWAAVIAIRLFFAGLAVFILTAIPTINVPRQHRTTKARAEVSEIGKAVGIYLTLTGRMPASLDDLRLPQERNGGDSIIDIADDPWGRPYGFIVDGPRAVTITSLGADGAPGGDGADEDIVLHWPPPKDPLPR